MSATQLLTLSDVNKGFALGSQQRLVLRSINLAVEDGAFVAFVGASGCGKSTLLRLIAGLETPDSGNVFLGKEQVKGPSRGCGMIFQDPRLLPWLTVAQNIDLALPNKEFSAAERKRLIAEHLELVGLSDFANVFPRQLSGGMAQRAAIARGLVNRPRLLLLDEPFSALDSLNRSRLQGELQRIWAYEKIAMVLVTHDVEEAVFLADRVVVLAPNPGRVSSIVEIPLPRSRDRNSVEFVALKATILRQLESYPEVPAI
jgi:sulfonate transport system ATP-binding protein